MSNREFGKSVRVVQLSYMVDRDNKKLFTAFYPKVSMDGQWMLIRDENAVGKSVNAPTRKEARKLGYEFLHRMEEKQALEGVKGE